MYFITLLFWFVKYSHFTLMMCYYLNVHFQDQRIKQCEVYENHFVHVPTNCVRNNAGKSTVTQYSDKRTRDLQQPHGRQAILRHTHNNYNLDVSLLRKRQTYRSMCITQATESINLYCQQRALQNRNALYLRLTQLYKWQCVPYIIKIHSVY